MPAKKTKAISNKAKAGTPTPLLAILLAAVVVLSAITVASIVLVKKYRTGAETVQVDKISALQSQIRQLFFDYNIPNDMFSMTETWDRATNDNVSMMYVAVPDNLTESLRSSAIKLFEHNKLPMLYSPSKMHLITTDADKRFELIINELNPKPEGDETPRSQNPYIQTPPAVQTPSVSNVNPTPPAKGVGQIALIIDDAGANLTLADRITKQSIPITMSVLPFLAYSKQTAELARSRGKTVFLHFPMEPKGYPATDPGEGAVFVSMPEIMIVETAKRNIENIGGVIDGVNNHMGSAATSDNNVMRGVIEAIRPFTSRFVDSNTSAQSVAYNVCKQAGFVCGINKKFLDNSNDHNYIRERLYEAARASSKGGIIIIGHLRKDTIEVLEETVPELQRLGYTFVSVTALTQ
ncbi:hypothetical protein RsTz2092_05950 [Deferribacterales bacterium RsTz2092]|nr:hypothetical protein AGMMS49941_03540 [Deferribacterales bacterium]